MPASNDFLRDDSAGGRPQRTRTPECRRWPLTSCLFCSLPAIRIERPRHPTGVRSVRAAERTNCSCFLIEISVPFVFDGSNAWQGKPVEA